MFLTLYFPGMSPLNMNELKEFADMYDQNNMTYYAHEYSHWKDEALEFNIDTEFDTVKNKVEELGEIKSYGFMGKSIGTYTVVETIERLGIEPKFVILMGIPMGIGEDKLEVYKRILPKLKNTKIILIQNDGDPYGKVDEVRDLLKDVEYDKLIMEGDNHLYSYAEEAYAMVKDLL